MAFPVVPGLQVRFQGQNTGTTDRYYWAQAVFPSGRSILSGPVKITGPANLDPSNYNLVLYGPVPGATSYFVLVTTTSASPTGTSNISVPLIGIGGAVDNGQAKSSWTAGSTVSGITTSDDVPEGVTNLYFTNARVLSELLTIFGDTSGASSSGTGYTLTATATLATFGTATPVTTLATAGNYLLFTYARLEHAGATYSANRTITVKLRRTNNTAADIVSALQTTGTPTTQTGNSMNLFMAALYTATAGDSVSTYASIDVIADAGSTLLSFAKVFAIRLT